MSQQTITKFVSEKIRFLRKSQELSQEDLAELLDVSTQTISQWENNKKRLHLEDLELISSYFKLDISDLLPPKLVDENHQS